MMRTWYSKKLETNLDEYTFLKKDMTQSELKLKQVIKMANDFSKSNSFSPDFKPVP